MSRELLQQALDALENGKKVRAGEGGTKYQPELEDAAIEALEAALAQPEQEPVAWMLPDYGDVLSASEADGTGIYNIPLYTAPPKREWVGLTDEEIKGILDCERGGLVDIKKAEQLLKEKNNAV